MSYSPLGAYEPAFWTVSSHDLKYTERLGSTGVSTNTAWIANLAVYVPFTLSFGGTIYEWWHLNGTLTTAYNIDYGIYNLDFTKVQSLGSTAGTTTASVLVNTTTWTDLAIAPGSYYMAFASDSTRNFTTSADAMGLYQLGGCMEQTTAFVLPSPAVPAVYTRAFLPHFGFNMRATAV
jgi:hypothetical protein